MISLYADTPTWLHRRSAGSKMLAIALASMGLSAGDAILYLSLGLAICLSLLLSIAPALRGARRLLMPALIAAGLVMAFHAVVGDPAQGLKATLRLLALAALGIIFVLTTRPSDVLVTVEGILQPLRRLGVNPERLSLQIGLVLRFTELFFALWQRLDEAHRLRTGKSGGVRLLAPLVIQVLRRSERVADALWVRIGTVHTKP
ncbi:MAG: energy-coupling factor transporter transmembrane protein EcfT [Limnohabitans sp.]|nr:energy-coupling factor transporter transmembrane protein EcfT [Limnohabitans sp.]